MRRSWYFGVRGGCEGKELKGSEEHIVIDVLITMVIGLLKWFKEPICFVPGVVFNQRRFSSVAQSWIVLSTLALRCHVP